MCLSSSFVIVNSGAIKALWIVHLFHFQFLLALVFLLSGFGLFHSINHSSCRDFKISIALSRSSVCGNACNQLKEFVKSLKKSKSLFGSFKTDLSIIIIP